MVLLVWRSSFWYGLSELVNRYLNLHTYMSIHVTTYFAIIRKSSLIREFLNDFTSAMLFCKI